MLLKIYLATVVLGIIAMIVTIIEIRVYTVEVVKEFDTDVEIIKKIKVPSSERALGWIKDILYVITPVLNILMFIGLFAPKREEYVKEGIRKGINGVLKYKPE